MKLKRKKKGEKIVLKVRISNEAISWLDALTSLTACVSRRAQPVPNLYAGDKWRDRNNAVRRISASIFGGEKGKGASSNVLAKNSATIDLRGIVAAWLANVHY